MFSNSRTTFSTLKLTSLTLKIVNMFFADLEIELGTFVMSISFARMRKELVIANFALIFPL